MALGGGTFTVQNKILPGAYINFVAGGTGGGSADSGIVTMPLALDWGRENEVFAVSCEDFQTNCLKIFGYAFDHEKMKGLRELFMNARLLYAYRLTSGGEKAANELAEAVCCGVRGNDIKIIVQKNADNESLYDVKTMLGGVVADVQTVANASTLKANDFVKFKSTATLTASATPTALSGGTNGTVNGAAYQAYLDKIESYSFNVMGLATDGASGCETTKMLFCAFTKRMREELGVKFQLVLHNYPAADSCGVISVKNETVAVGGHSKESLVYWVAGISASCPVNRSNQNRLYDGEFAVLAEYTRQNLTDALTQGEFVLHRVGENEFRVLDDVNTLSSSNSDIFKNNQSVRISDYITGAISSVFVRKYLGGAPNNAAGRAAFWSDVVKILTGLNELGAIENFSDADVTVTPGENKKSVVVNAAIQVVNAIDKLYMTVTVN